MRLAIIAFTATALIGPANLAAAQEAPSAPAGAPAGPSAGCQKLTRAAAGLGAMLSVVQKAKAEGAAPQAGGGGGFLGGLGALARAAADTGAAQAQAPTGGPGPAPEQPAGQLLGLFKAKGC